MKRLSFALFCAAILPVGAPAQALTVFLGADPSTGIPTPGPNAAAAEAAFITAAGTTTLVDFENVPNGPFNSLSPVAGLTLTGQRAGGGSQQVTDTPSCAVNCGGNITLGGLKFVELYGGSLTATFASAISAFGVYVDGVQQGNVTLTFNNGTQQSITLDPVDPDATFGVGALNFVGFTDTTNSILSVTLTAGNDILSFDDLRYSFAETSAPVPEPATWAMMIAGFGLVGAGMRRKTNIRVRFA